ncbi:MAG: hypothetical protein K8H88_30150, partial [Sandaracinaceae bacterium]|nr:hypothetical protein [Sandaracinaceae bacterium]
MRTLANSLAVCCFVAFVALAPLQKAHAVPLLNTFGGPAGYGTSSLAANDDSYSAELSLTTAFPTGVRFFSGTTTYNTFYVNNNGNITFAGGVSQYTPTPFPIASRPMIAPYWGDVDTRGVRDANNNMVYWHLEPGRLIVTWHNVGVFNINDSVRMDFQLILTNALGCGSGDFEVEFRYNRCEWEAGSASGDSNRNGICDSGETTCVPAQAGFDAGNLTDFVEIPGSRTSAIRNLCTTSNVGMPGIWRFSVRGGMISCPGTGEPCDTGMAGACGVGLTACVGREERCVQLGTSSAERCDGVDNDCNGMVDDGSLCTAPNLCVSGSCVPPCFEGGCNLGETCNTQGICVETACEGVSCPPGQRCRGGSCVGACEGIVCPHGQQCAAGRCQDLCDLLTCGDGEVCVDGSCRPTCPCYPCGPGETCLADGTCESAGCDVVLCD